MRFLPVLTFLATFIPLSTEAVQAQAPSRERVQPSVREQLRQKVNENLIILMAGGLGGPYLQLAADIATTVNDGDSLRVLPTISNGAVENVRDILFLRGVDLGITTIQTLNALKASGEFGPGLERQIAYIAPLSVDMFHVLAGPGINTLDDLKGKKVAFNLVGSGTARFGPAVFKTLGINFAEPERQIHMSQGDAIQAIRNGEISATLCSCPIPIPAHAALKADSGFRFLEIPYPPALEQDYLPASFTPEHYPNLIAKDQKVDTIATSTILITFNWAPGTERYKRIEKFVNAFFANAEKLRQPPRHPAWRQVNMAATMRGWQRFPAAQEWIDRMAATPPKGPGPKIDPSLARTQAARAAPGDVAEQERLFKEFLEWSRQKAR